jgi:hypothetical protein
MIFMLWKGCKSSKFLTRVCYHAMVRESSRTRGRDRGGGNLVHRSRALRRWPVQGHVRFPTGGPG